MDLPIDRFKSVLYQELIGLREGLGAEESVVST